MVGCLAVAIYVFRSTSTAQNKLVSPEVGVGHK